MLLPRPVFPDLGAAASGSGLSPSLATTYVAIASCTIGAWGGALDTGLCPSAATAPVRGRREKNSHSNLNFVADLDRGPTAATETTAD